MDALRATGSHLAEMYARAAELYGGLPAFATRRARGQWTPVGFRELFENGRALATALIELGVGAREHVGLLGDNRLEWILADYGVQLCGAADVPRGRDVTDAEIEYILRHAGVRVTFVETACLAQRVSKLRGKLPDLDEIILLEAEGSAPDGTRRLGDLVARGHELRAAGDRRVEERMAGIRPDDLFTLIYTSGTTGEPKGVMLTHANIMSQMENIGMEIRCTDRVLSILPVWHVFERVFEMIAVSRGCCTYYTSPRHLADDLTDVEPTFMGSAPRLWENLHQRILKRVRETHPVRQVLFHTAYFLAHYYKESVFFLTHRQLSLRRRGALWRAGAVAFHVLRWFLLLPWYGFFNAAVLEKLRLVVGGAFKGSVSGGGALPREVDQFFNYLGIPVLEGYGLTETSPVVAVRTPAKLVIGTVGPLIPRTEVRIADPETGEVLCPDPACPHGGRGRRGEVEVRGPQVMKGYYRNPEATKAALRDGWFRTGDLGMMTFNDCLRIVGRLKDTIVLSSGENLEPVPIEARLNQSPLIEHAMVVGQDRKFPAVLIVPAAEAAESADGELPERIGAEIRARVSVAGGFKAHELVRDFRIVVEPFRVGAELTNLQKLRRHVVTEKYSDLIESMYAQDTQRKERKP
ncbi:MAG: long-chain fatty acid--CoA ligase [Opitutales bacterium]|nr:long-chain fatty acid--CoA ligase [Opitutales bacterium]